MDSVRYGHPLHRLVVNLNENSTNKMNFLNLYVHETPNNIGISYVEKFYNIMGCMYRDPFSYMGLSKLVRKIIGFSPAPCTEENNYLFFLFIIHFFSLYIII